MVKIGIIGGGRGGTSILKLLCALTHVDLQWIAEVRKDFPAQDFAREQGLEVTSDFQEKLQKDEKEKVDIVIDVSGADQVKKQLLPYLSEGLTVIDGDASKLLFSIVEQREEMLVSLQRQVRQLTDAAAKLSSSIKQIRESTEGLALGAELFAAYSESLTEITNNARHSMKDTEEILTLIERVAKKTNIIGLNAAIEANRVGEEGAGFAVVAGEIRKLAENSTTSVKEVSGIIEKVAAHMKEMTEGADRAGVLARNQALITEELLLFLKKVSGETDRFTQLSLQLATLK